MEILENLSLKRYNTFGIEATARFFCEITSVEELKKALRLTGYPKKIILGGGSNILIAKNIDALVLYINIKGIQIEKEDENTVVLNVMAGENWHHMVLWTLEKGFGGLENLSLIPGNTGTAPVQNIGAYGVELKDVFDSCLALQVDTQEMKVFTKADCKFGYRDSYFKTEGVGKYIIVSVNLRLTKKAHKKNTSYGSIEAELQKNNIRHPTIKDVSDAVVAIRKSKLPDPVKIGNSGSFFKNPMVDKKILQGLLKKHPGIPFFKVSENEYKIPAGWLIEQCGYKGKRYGDAGVHKDQALVLVNHGNATGQEILDLATRIMEDVHLTFNIAIVPEVNIIK